MTTPKSAAELADAHTKSVWAHGEMLPKHMSEAYIAGHASRDLEVRELEAENKALSDKYDELYELHKQQSSGIFE